MVIEPMVNGALPLFNRVRPTTLEPETLAL